MPMNQGQTGVRAPFELDLRLAFAPDGAPRLNGVIRFHDDPASAAPGPFAPVLVATRSVLDAACADIDNDGAGGLTRLAAEFQAAGSREPTRVVLAPAAHDVDADGIYTVALQIGQETLTGDARFRITGDPARTRRAR